jgi:RHS repeat-associated protein
MLILGQAPREDSTGKERDAETGLDYFGARYYAGTQGKFTSSDPLPWLKWQHGSEKSQQRFQDFINDPQKLNLYVYVGNNPLNYIDPTGMYICNGNPDQCRAVAQYLIGGIYIAGSLSRGSRMEKWAAKRLMDVVRFYGRPGTNNDVTVDFESSDPLRHAHIHYERKLLGGYESYITLGDPDIFSWPLGIQLVFHEGAHGIVGPPKKEGLDIRWDSQLAHEIFAYRTEAIIIYGVLGREAGMAAASQIMTDATEGAHFDCLGLCYDEPAYHFPWDN